MPPLSREAFGEQLGVSRETLERLTVHLDLLRRWQPAINLVGSATLADPWRRHFLDSAQLAGICRMPPRTSPTSAAAPDFRGWCWRCLGSRVCI